MSRVAKNPVIIPEKVEVSIASDAITIKSPLGELKQELTGDVEIKSEENILTFKALKETKFAKAMSGTVRSLVHNMVTGVTKGFEKKLITLFLNLVQCTTMLRGRKGVIWLILRL